MKTIFSVLTFTLIQCALIGQTSIDQTFTYQSASRSYSIRVPQSYNASKPMKLMVGMHGNGWSSLQWRNELMSFTDSCDMLLLCPDGQGNVLDDTAMTTVLIDSMKNWYNVDTNEIFICGFSNGGKAVYTYGLDHPDLYAGYMPIGAFTDISDLTSSRKLNAIDKPFAIVHGANDFPQTRFYPSRDSLLNYTTKMCDTLLVGVGHQANFPNNTEVFIELFKCLESNLDTVFKVEAGTDRSLCGNDSIFLGNQIDINAGTGPFNFSWSPSIGLSDSVSSNPKCNVTTDTQFILKVRGADGRIVRDTILVKAFTIPLVDAGIGDTICPNTATPLMAIGANSYVWQNATGLSCTKCASPSFTTASKRTLYVTGTDTNGCSATDSVTLDVFPPPVIKSSADTTICIGDTGQFHTSGAISYRWSSSNNLTDSTISNPFFFPQSSSLFAVYGTDSNNCIGSDLISVTVRKLPLLLVNDDTTICNGDPLLMYVRGANKVKWNAVDSLSCDSCQNTWFYPTGSGKVNVTGTDFNGCISSKEINIGVRPKFNAKASQDTSICEGDTVFLRANNGVSFNWVQGNIHCKTCAATHSQPIIAGHTTYMVEITDQNKCSDTAQIKVTVNAIPSITVSSDTTICNGDTISLSASTNGVVNWKTDSSLGDSLSITPKVWPIAQTTYTVRAVSNSGCANETTTTVNVQSPSADFLITGTGSKRIYDPTPSTNYDNYTFDYKNGVGTSGNDEFEYSENGEFEICLRVSTDLGCTSDLCKKVEIFGLGLGSNSQITGITVFPNPASDAVFVQSKTEILAIAVFNLLGEKVLVNETQSSINVASLVSGKYILEVETANSISRFPLIKD